MTDLIAVALDGFVPAFDSAEGDWQAILRAASLPQTVAGIERHGPVSSRRFRSRAPFARRAVRVAIVLAVLAVMTTGIAWATGAFKPTPRELFQANPQGRLNAASGLGGIWNQKAVPHSVKKVASVDIPKVGPVAFWYARAKQGGWCAGLRLRNGDWLGTPEAHLLRLGPGGRSIGSGGGVVPGCFPTEKQKAAAGQGPTPTRFECIQAEVDARSVGELWQIRYGLVTAPGAVTVRDLTSGQSTNVVGGNFFLLAIRHPPRRLLRLHLIAYDKAGKVIANGRRVAYGC